MLKQRTSRHPGTSFARVMARGLGALSATLLSCAVVCSSVSAQTLPELKLPPETARLKPSRLEGYQIAMQKCGICHSADYINLQPPAMSQMQWTAEVRKMEHAYAAPLSDTDVTQIGEYLAVAYGGAKPSATPVAATQSVKADAQATKVDAQALLTANGCLGCHAIAQKVVGPAYHDVALKYKNEPLAQSKLEASIRNGSTGHWGPTPMPAFAALSPAELKALAAFVLKQ